MSDSNRSESASPVGGSASVPVRVDVTTDFSNADPATSDSAAGLASPLPLSAGRYQMLDEIAHGGMGVIWRATDTTLGREVAIKALQDKFAPDSGIARRFADEARSRPCSPGSPQKEELQRCVTRPGQAAPLVIGLKSRFTAIRLWAWRCSASPARRRLRFSLRT